MKLSECCSAIPTNDIETVTITKTVELGFCSHCREHTTFVNKESNETNDG